MKPTHPAVAAPDYGTQLASLLELDERHDELLRRLEELDTRVEKVLADWSVRRAALVGGDCSRSRLPGGILKKGPARQAGPTG
ncbi:MAG: hypothetical protein ABR915_14980 [Thermoguttaceae bacterium]|jgi:hypothetical protein